MKNAKLIQNLNKSSIFYSKYELFFNKLNNNRLKLARISLNLSQGEIAELSGISQRDVSQLENGKKSFIPTSYIHFLNSRGIDLNSLFSEDDHDLVVVGEPKVEYGSPRLSDPSVESVLYERLLKAKDETIASLQALVAELRKKCP